MTATATPTTRRPTAVTRPPDRSVPIGGVIGSEWTKLRSVRSTYWTIAAMIVTIVGLGALVSAAVVSRWNSTGKGQGFNFDAGQHSLRGIFVAQLAIGVLGALVITAEYGTGMIRNTFAATPQRRTVLWVKAGVFGSVALIAGLIGSFAAFATGQAIMAPMHVGMSLGTFVGIRVAVGGGLYLAMVGLLALGIGAMVRHTAGAIATLFGVVLVLPGLVEALPSPWNDDVSKFLPSGAGQAMMQRIPDHASLSPLAGGLVLAGYVVAALGAATVIIHHRDA